MMHDSLRFPRSWALWLFFLPACAQIAWAQAPLKTIHAQQGGTIAYGLVDGAETPAAAMGKILRTVHDNCGEKPQIGNVFKFRGTDTVGVFFTVVNHAGGDKQVAGLVVAAQVGSRQVEGALMSDDASRFGSTVNPMLKQLLGVWHPGGGAASGSAAGARPVSGSTGGGHSAPAAKLHKVVASDNSVSIGIPDGWTLDPRSGGGVLIVTGPNGESMGLHMTRVAIDPTNPQQRQLQRNGIRAAAPGQIVYPYHGDLVNAFPNLFQQWRRAAGQAPAELQIDQIEQMPAPQGEQCVHVKGHLNPDGRGMQTMNDMMCAMEPGSWGAYMLILNHSLFPNSLADQEHDTVVAMMASWQLNQEVLNQQMAAANQQKAANDQMIMRNAQQRVDQIHQIGQQATARYNATQAANDAQHAGYWAQQDSNARTAQGFSNYQLDQTVIQDNNAYGNGTAGHATVWNSTASALVKADPNRFEMVDTPNYWKGVDY